MLGAKKCSIHNFHSGKFAPFLIQKSPNPTTSSTTDQSQISQGDTGTNELKRRTVSQATLVFLAFYVQKTKLNTILVSIRMGFEIKFHEKHSDEI